MNTFVISTLVACAGVVYLSICLIDAAIHMKKLQADIDVLRVNINDDGSFKNVISVSATAQIEAGVVPTTGELSDRKASRDFVIHNAGNIARYCRVNRNQGKCRVSLTIMGSPREADPCDIDDIADEIELNSIRKA